MELHNSALLGERLGLLDAVDGVLNRGVVLQGDAMVSLAGVDLVYLRLSLVLSSVETLLRSQDRDVVAPNSYGDASRNLPGSPLGHSSAHLQESAAGTGAVPDSQGRAIPSTGASSADVTPAVPQSERPEQGLAQLVLTLVELLRQLVERQAIRRMEGGRLSDDEVESMGKALLGLEARMTELREVFQLSDDDLNIDLGPLGKLL